MSADCQIRFEQAKPIWNAWIMLATDSPDDVRFLVDVGVPYEQAKAFLHWLTFGWYSSFRTLEPDTPDPARVLTAAEARFCSLLLGTVVSLDWPRTKKWHDGDVLSVLNMPADEVRQLRRTLDAASEAGTSGVATAACTWSVVAAVDGAVRWRERALR